MAKGFGVSGDCAVQTTEWRIAQHEFWADADRLPDVIRQQRLVAAGKRFRGHSTDESDASHGSSLPPAVPLDGSPTDSMWCGHEWSSWMPFPDAGRRREINDGLYRIRRAAAEILLYAGEGAIRSRLTAHARKGTMMDHRQNASFARTDTLEVSVVSGDTWQPYQRLELETDLIAAHLLATGEIPAAQFVG